MFSDFSWNGARTDEQDRRWDAWLAARARDGKKIVVVEVGAGTAIPTVRITSRTLCKRLGAHLIRINLEEPERAMAEPGVSFATGGLAALLEIEKELNKLQ